MWKTIYPRRRKENNSNEEEGAKEELTTKIRIRSWSRRRKNIGNVVVSVMVVVVMVEGK